MLGRNRQRISIFIDSPGFGGSEIDLLSLIDELKQDLVFDIYLNRNRTNVKLIQELRLRLNFSDGSSNIVFAPTGILLYELFNAFFFFVKILPSLWNVHRILFWCHHQNSSRIYQVLVALVFSNKMVVSDRLVNPRHLSVEPILIKLKYWKQFVVHRAVNVVCGENMINIYREFGVSGFYHVLPTARKFNTRRLRRRQGINFIVACRLEKVKNVDDIILAFASVVNSHEGARLFIAGAGSEISNLKRLVDSLSITTRVHFLGFVHDLSIYSGCQYCFISASGVEGLPGSVIEAWERQNLVLVSRIPAHREIVGDNFDGYFLLNDTDTLVKKMLDILNGHITFDEKLYDQIKNRFDSDFVFLKWKELLL